MLKTPIQKYFYLFRLQLLYTNFSFNNRVTATKGLVTK